MSDPILNGTDPAADRRLIADVMKADASGVPDDFDQWDGGCPADVLPRRVPVARANDIPAPADLEAQLAKGKAKIAAYQFAPNELLAAHMAAGKVYYAIVEALRVAYHEADEVAECEFERYCEQRTTESHQSYRLACRYRDGLSAAWDIAIKTFPVIK